MVNMPFPSPKQEWVNTLVLFQHTIISHHPSGPEAVTFLSDWYTDILPDTNASRLHWGFSLSLTHFFSSLGWSRICFFGIFCMPCRDVYYDISSLAQSGCVPWMQALAFAMLCFTLGSSFGSSKMYLFVMKVTQSNQFPTTTDHYYPLKCL